MWLVTSVVSHLGLWVHPWSIPSPAMVLPRPLPVTSLFLTTQAPSWCLLLRQLSLVPVSALSLDICAPACCLWNLSRMVLQVRFVSSHSQGPAVCPDVCWKQLASHLILVHTASPCCGTLRSFITTNNSVTNVYVCVFMSVELLDTCRKNNPVK